MSSAKKVLLIRSSLDQEQIATFKILLIKEGFDVKDIRSDDCVQLILTNDLLNAKKNEELLSLFEPCIDEAELIVVLVDKSIKDEMLPALLIEFAAKKGKYILAVLLNEIQDDDIPQQIVEFGNGGIVSIDEVNLFDILREKEEVWQQSDATEREKPLATRHKPKECK